jgi:hypothetical protein
VIANLPNELIASEKPVSADTIVWRYLSFKRFVEILQTHALWFPRPVRFEDQWEGRFPPSYMKRTRQFADARNIPFEEFCLDFRKRLQRHRYAHFVSCWQANDHESDAMWRLYAPAGTGIAIQSTVGDVNHCLRPHNSGWVIYYDPSDDVRSATTFGPHDILFKRSTFYWEREYRFWLDDDELLDKIEAGHEIRQEDLSPGRLVRISDMRRLIKKIVVAPGASDEFIERARAACAERKKRWLSEVIEQSYSDRIWDSFTA